MSIRYAPPETVKPTAKRPTKAAMEAPPLASGRKRGPKPTGNAKQLITLRLDPDVIAGFRSAGDGWQARINAVLRHHLKI